MNATRLNQRGRVLARLQEGPATSADLNALCYRYGARILELRRAGYKILTARTSSEMFVYTLITA